MFSLPPKGKNVTQEQNYICITNAKYLKYQQLLQYCTMENMLKCSMLNLKSIF